MSDPRFLQEDGTAVFTGNELILKGALEAEVALITGYPGSPVSDIFDAAYANRELLKEHGVLAEMANNEALSVARLNGSRMAGIRAMAVMKSVGLHVAADGLALGNLAEARNKGGGVVVVGDDPWIESTQINNDSRYLSQHLHMPVLEPGTLQEVKDWVNLAFELSSESDLYLTYLVTTNQMDGGGTVWVYPNRYPTVNTKDPVTLETDQFNLEKTVLLPPRTWTQEATLPERFERLLLGARQRSLNRLSGPADGQRRPFGIITSGLCFSYLEQALAEMGLSGKVPILKLGLSYPVDGQDVLRLAERVDSLVVIEEKRGFVESQVIGVLHAAHQEGKLPHLPRVWGKRFPEGRPGFPETRGLNASLIEECLLPLFRQQWPGLTETEERHLEVEAVLLSAIATMSSEALPARTPTFCPGCPHRDSSSVFIEIKRDFRDPAYMKLQHNRGPMDLVFHGETGCFSMLMFEPNQGLMHNYSGMGIGGGTGAGLDPFVTNKQVVFLGDSTFFHSGMVAISDSIKSGQDITYVILDNKTTAMTGHQPTPGTELDLMGEKTFAQSIERIVAAMGSVTVPVRRVNPDDRESYRALLEEMVLADGVKIVIADKECGLTYHRQEKEKRHTEIRSQGFLAEEKVVNVNPDVCEFCLECTKTTGCPGLTIEQTDLGPKMVTDLTHCVSDGACARIKACPSFQEVTIRRKQPAPFQNALPLLEALPPAPVARFEARWNAYTAGVGGMGAGLLSSILVRAGHAEGYRVLFLDKKGLAVRNGSVFGHVLFSREGGARAPLVSFGKADLILGIDLLETARSMVYATRAGAVINTAVHPTVRMLLGQDEPNVAVWEKIIQQHVPPNRYWGADLSAVSQHYFGSTLYTNLMLLGAANQRGEIPVSSERLEEAIIASVNSEERDTNLAAFRAGRALVVRPQAFRLPQKPHTTFSLREEKTIALRQTTDAAQAEAFRLLAQNTVQALPLDETTHRAVTLRLYELSRYENLAYAQRYADLLLRTAKQDRAEWNFEATRAVIENAFRAMAIKDEVYVAQLLTSPEARARDLERFRINEAAGDTLEYRFINRPEFVLFGQKICWDMRSRAWQLKFVARMKFLRRWLPDWHREEKEFRDWYLGLVQQFEANNTEEYERWVNILKCVEGVKGFRQIRKPLMEKAKRKVAILTSSPAVSSGGPKVIA